MDPVTVAAEIRNEIARLPRRDTPSIRALRRRRSTELKPVPADDVLALAAALEAASAQEGKWVAYELIRFHPGAFAAITETEVDRYARQLASWYATDAFGTILAGPLWAKGRISDDLVQIWAADDDHWLRRAALVATVGRNGAATGPGGAAPTLRICRRLATDRDDMVVKGLSWALRELSKRDRVAVEGFLAETGPALAARVRREVAHKLATGLKTPRPR